MHPRSKKAYHEDFSRRIYTPEDFQPNDNIGVVNGHGVVDIDLDQPEAVEAAKFLLPVTRTHGRPGKPSSHWWYKCNIEPFNYKDLDGTILLEIRSNTSNQTVVPPSIHDKTGELIAWDYDRAMLEMLPKDLRMAANAVAITALFARHWPSGSRHYAAGHVAGFLLRLGFDGPWTIQIIRTIATIAKDEEVNDRVAIARATAEKHARGEKTTGGPKLAEIFGRGRDLAARVYTWMGKDGEELLDSLNDQHFVVELGCDTVVGTERLGKPPYFKSFDEFRKMYYNQFVGKKNLGEFWLRHPQRRSYREVVFAPPPVPCHDEDFNLWRGFALDPDPHPRPEERCKLFLELLFRVICDNNEEWFAYLLDLLAMTVQRPGTPTGVAVVMRGEPGAGKGTFVSLFGRLFGVHYAHIDKQFHLVGNFNALIAGKVVVFADEAMWGGNKSDVGALRRLVTESTLTVERKHKDAVTEHNCIHLFLATNEEWVWPASLKERRSFILDVEQKVFADKAYFSAIRREWEREGGDAAFLAFLLQRPVEELPDKIPDTPALQEQQRLGLDPIHQWWVDKLTTGEINYEEWPEFISHQALYNDFLDVTDKMGARNRRLTLGSFVRAHKKLLPTRTRESKQPCQIEIMRRGVSHTATKKMVGFLLPSLDTCRKRFDTITGLKYDWPAIEPEQQDLVGVGDDIV